MDLLYYTWLFKTVNTKSKRLADDKSLLNLNIVLSWMAAKEEDKEEAASTKSNLKHKQKGRQGHP